MPRQLQHIVAIEYSKRDSNLGRPKGFDRVYGPSYTELVRYLRDKYGIREKYVTAILWDVFRYIEMEVLAGAGAFTVPRFGRFLRREIRHGESDGSTVDSIVMRFTRANTKQSFIDFEDEEWVDE